jgi:hypothetical protein
MELITERLHDEGIMVLLFWFAFVFKRAYFEQGAQGTADGDRQQDYINDQPYEEPHGERRSSEGLG